MNQKKAINQGKILVYHNIDWFSKEENTISVFFFLIQMIIITLKGYKIVNIDSTVIAQRPKLSPYIDLMRANIAESCSISIDDVSVKATTEEKMGFTGEGMGIAAHAVVLIEK